VAWSPAQGPKNIDREVEVTPLPVPVSPVEKRFEPLTTVIGEEETKISPLPKIELPLIVLISVPDVTALILPAPSALTNPLIAPVIGSVSIVFRLTVQSSDPGVQVGSNVSPGL